MREQAFDQLFEQLTRLKVGVIGDVMLDSYIWGSTERISPEAPVPVVTLKKREYRIGGAGNVALNIVSLGAKATMLSVIGNDEAGAKLSGLLEENGIDTAYLLRSPERITTNKTRIISRNQQMMRLDDEQTTDLSEKDEAKLWEAVQNYVALEQPDILIFEDYNKGVLTEKIIAQTTALCRAKQILTAVDPKRKNFFAYKGVDIFKPNLKEAREALNLLNEEVSLSGLSSMHKALQEKLRHQISFITLSEKGVFYENNVQRGIIPSHLRNIADVSGAGDTVIATGSLIYKLTGNPQLMAEIANIAGGLVCEEVGTAAINRNKLLAECKLLLNSTSSFSL